MKMEAIYFSETSVNSFYLQRTACWLLNLVYSWTPKMDSICPSKTSLNSYQTVLRYIQKKSYLSFCLFGFYNNVLFFHPQDGGGRCMRNSDATLNEFRVQTQNERTGNFLSERNDAAVLRRLVLREVCTHAPG
jgi:hypothetical protein